MLAPLPAPARCWLTTDTAALRWALAAVLPHAAKTPTLPTLATVRVEADTGRLTLIATDRYTLAAATVPLDTPADAAVLVAVRDVRRLLRLLRDNHGGDATLTLASTAVTVATTAGQWHADPVPGAYPQWRQLLATHSRADGPPARWHGFDPALLARFTTAVPAGAAITLRTGGDGQPALVTAPRFAGLVMPMRHHQPPDTGGLLDTPDPTAATRAA